MMTQRLEALTPGWFDQALVLAARCMDQQAGLDAEVGVDIFDLGVAYTERYVDGVLVAFEPGHDDAAIVVRRDLETELAIRFDPGAGTRAAAATTIAFECDGRRVTGPFPPLSHCLGTTVESRLRGATTRVQMRLHNSPFGIVDAFICVRDGLVAASGFGMLAESDLSIETAYVAMNAMLLGELSPTECFDRAHFDGDLQSLSQFFGVLLGDELAARAASHRPVTTTFNRLAMIVAQPGYARWRHALVETTEVSV